MTLAKDPNAERKVSPLSWLFLAIIRGYQQYVSPLLGDNCRFNPTCSKYAMDAISLYGIIRGGSMTVRRIGKCHPWNDGGNDPVPDSFVSHVQPQRSSS